MAPNDDIDEDDYGGYGDYGSDDEYGTEDVGNAKKAFGGDLANEMGMIPDLGCDFEGGFDEADN